NPPRSRLVAPLRDAARRRAHDRATRLLRAEGAPRGALARRALPGVRGLPRAHPPALHSVSLLGLGGARVEPANDVRDEALLHLRDHVVARPVLHDALDALFLVTGHDEELRPVLSHLVVRLERRRDPLGARRVVALAHELRALREE